MARLKELFEALGFAEVETFIASGNVLFSSKERDSSKLESRIARQLEAALGYQVDTFVRTEKEVSAIKNVFPEEAGITVHVGFFQKALSPEVARKLGAVRTKDDEIEVHGREFYWLCRGRSHESKVWMSPEIKALGLPTSSMRNLTSIRKLIAKHLE